MATTRRVRDELLNCRVARISADLIQNDSKTHDLIHIHTSVKYIPTNTEESQESQRWHINHDWMNESYYEPCHVPKLSRPLVIGICIDGPTNVAFVWDTLVCTTAVVDPVVRWTKFDIYHMK